MQLIKYIFLIMGVFLASEVHAQDKIVLGENGLTPYTIYIDTAATAELKKAAGELVVYCKKVASIQLQVKTAVGNMQVPFISLGKTSAALAAGLYNSPIPADAFRIVTKGKNIFIAGDDTPQKRTTSLGGVSRGTTNGVYTFIEDYLGVKWLTPFAEDEYLPRLTKIELPQINRLDTAFFLYRKVPYIGTGVDVEQWRLHTLQGGISSPTYDHAWLATIPSSAFTQHPDWFAQADGNPLPPSGDYKFETTNPELVQAYANAIIETFRKDPKRYWYSLSPSDGAGWSDSPESLALTEKDPTGAVSRTPLILKFYNDVAKIVGREFPDRKLGGYIYASYLYPPSKGMPRLEPNLGLVVAPSIGYGYRLYRADVRAQWEQLIHAWGDAAKRDGFDLYYYDLPNSLVQYNGILPPAPDILNFIYTRLIRYGFKGSYVYGIPVWPAFGAMNYTIAKLTWNPALDANKVLKDYYTIAYGAKAAVYIDSMYALLEKGFDAYYQKYPNATYNMTKNHLKEIYGPIYPKLDACFLQAYKSGSTAGEKKQLQHLADVFSLMQWNMKANGLLAQNYTSPFTISDNELDSLLQAADRANNPVARPLVTITPEKKFTVDKVMQIEERLAANVALPLFKNSRLLLHVVNAGEVQIDVKKFDANAEFIRYYLSDAKGQIVVSGGMRQGRSINFTGEAGKDYLLDLPSRGASVQLNIKGAVVAYKANPTQIGLRIVTSMLDAAEVPLYFYVPATVKAFSVTMSDGTVANLVAPDGSIEGVLDNTKNTVSRLYVAHAEGKQGFWKVVLSKSKDQLRITSFSLDKQLPQWIMTNPSELMEISGVVSDVFQGD